MSKLIKILVNFALLLIKLSGLLWRASIYIVALLLKPFGSLSRLVYYNLVLPLYRVYLIALKKMGWSKSRSFNPIVAILVNKNFIHILVVLLAVLIFSQNVMASDDALASDEVVGKTPLAKLVSDELSDKEELIEEFQDEDLSVVTRSATQSQNNLALRPETAITTIEQVPSLDSVDDDLIQESPEMTEDDITPETPNLSKRTEVIEYEVRDGDTASTIAEKFGISVNTILWENNLSAKGLIRPGDKLKILPFTGVRHVVKRGETLSTIAKYYEINQDEIIASNNISGALKSGSEILIPGGRQITVKTPTGKPIVKPGVKPSLGKVTDSAPATPVSGAKMNWPTAGYTITQYYSWRHNGIDVANKIGTPIYASDAGVVERAEWNSGGYGYMILIDHGGGKKTRYGHLSSFKVSAGDSVSKGQVIGGMGSTGRSTGSHLHFEVIIGGKRYNPLNYLAY